MTLNIEPISVGFIAVTFFGSIAIRCCRKRDSEGMVAFAFLAVASVFGTIAALI